MSEDVESVSSAPWLHTKRTFQLWDYSPSHGQLLLRSTPDEFHDTNLDLTFLGVEWLQLDRVVTNLSVRESHIQDFSEILGSRQFLDGSKMYEVRGGSGSSLIVADDFAHEENDLDMFSSSLSFSETPIQRAQRVEAKVAAIVARTLVDWTVDVAAGFSARGTSSTLGAGREVDVIALSPDGNDVLLVEVKSYSRPARNSHLQPAMKKMLNLAEFGHAGGFRRITAMLIIDAPSSNWDKEKAAIDDGEYFRLRVTDWSPAEDSRILGNKILEQIDWMGQGS